jgi:hypothetical protein
MRRGSKIRDVKQRLVFPVRPSVVIFELDDVSVIPALLVHPSQFTLQFLEPSGTGYVHLALRDLLLLRKSS